MIKIVHVKEDLPGGTENYCKGLKEILCNESQVSIDVPKIPQNHSRFFKYYYDKAVLESYIQDADVVHINGYTAQGTIDAFRLAHKMGKKIVYTAHFHPFHCLSHPFLGKLNFHMRIKPLIKKYADVVATINDEDTAFFKAFHHNVVRIPHWNRCLTTDDAQPVARNPRMILFVGRINDQVKNFQQILSIEEGKYEIHCVGRGEIPSNRKDIIQHVGISDEELSLLYRQASLLVVPSKYEAFCFAALEALSVGTPVVMSDRVRIADHLEGICGYGIFSYGDNAGFLEKVEQMIGASVDCDKVKERFAPERIAARYLELYTSLK